jgi:hypothetical protein
MQPMVAEEARWDELANWRGLAPVPDIRLPLVHGSSERLREAWRD